MTEQGDSLLFNYVEEIRNSLENISSVRDQTLQRSRQLIRTCAHTIRAIHRHEWPEAASLLAQAGEEAKEMVVALENFPDLYHTGYTQDALKELVEAHMVYAVSQ